MSGDASEFRFCHRCGGALAPKLVKRGEPERLVCGACDHVLYLNPKVAAGTVFEIDRKLVLLRRAIEPAYGKWVFPGGFVDRGETVVEAAIRETREEASVQVEVRDLLGVFSYSGSPVVVIVYTAQVISGVLEAADETLEAAVFEPHEIPWKELAFPSTRDALKGYLRRYACPRREPT